MSKVKLRNYSQSTPEEVAEIIRSEVQETGKSEGWCGSIERKEKVEQHLSEHGIAYTDDMFGRWEKRPGTKEIGGE